MRLQRYACRYTKRKRAIDFRVNSPGRIWNVDFYFSSFVHCRHKNYFFWITNGSIRYRKRRGLFDGTFYKKWCRSTSPLKYDGVIMKVHVKSSLEWIKLHLNFMKFLWNRFPWMQFISDLWSILDQADVDDLSNRVNVRSTPPMMSCSLLSTNWVVVEDE